MAFLGQLLLVHLGRRCYPEFGRDVAFAFQQFGGGAEVTDIGHAAANEDFVDDGARYVGQGFDIVRIVGAGHDGFVYVGQIDFDDGSVFGIGVGFQKLRVVQPGLHGLDATAQRAFVFIAVGNHPLQQRDVAVDVFDDGLFVQAHGAAGCRAFGGSVGQLESLFDLQVGQTFDFKDATRENVLLALFGYSQQILLDG